jgi:geranylgeranyl diphosphate synthase type I
MTFDPLQPLGTDFRDAVGRAVSAFLEGQRRRLDAIGSEVRPLLDQALHFTSAGKRFRPAFCYWGYVAAAGEPADEAAVVRAAGSLDLLHVSALAHDDVMDASATRRGGPSSHVMFAGAHSGADWRGGSESFGRAGAILLGDLLIMWSAEMWGGSGLAPEALERARPYLDAVRTEVTVGQYLDMVAQVAATDPSSALDRAGRVLEYKSARYTVMRPSQLGAALGGGSPELVEGLGRYGSPLGRAFQLRDDVLGVFGDEAVTGKPAGDDLREGKRTLLVAHAMALASRPAADRLDSLLGDPRLDTSGIAEAREIIVASGALARVEKTIVAELSSARTALVATEMDDRARTAFESLAKLAVDRVA